MNITIGERTLTATMDAAVADAIVASTGCSPAEHAAALRIDATPFQIARAVNPVVGLPVDELVDLMGALSADDLVALRLEVAALLTSEEGNADADA